MPNIRVVSPSYTRQQPKPRSGPVFGLTPSGLVVEPAALVRTRALGSPTVTNPDSFQVPRIISARKSHTRIEKVMRSGPILVPRIDPITLSPSALVRTRAQGTPVVSPTVLTAALVRTRALGTPTVSTTLGPSALVRTRVQGTPTVSPTILTAALVRTRALGSPTVAEIAATQIPKMIRVVQAHTRPEPKKTSGPVYGLTSSAAATELAPAALVRTRAQGTPVVNPTVVTSALVRTRAQGTPVVNTTLGPASLVRTRAQGDPTVSSVVVISIPKVTRVQQAHQKKEPTKRSGPTFGLTPTAAPASTTLSPLGLTRVDDGIPLLLGSPDRQRALGTPTLSSTSVTTLSPASLVRSRALGTPRVSPTLGPASITRTRALGSPALSTSTSAASLVRVRALGTPKVNPTILVSSLVNNRALGSIGGSAIAGATSSNSVVGLLMMLKAQEPPTYVKRRKKRPPRSLD